MKPRWSIGGLALALLVTLVWFLLVPRGSALVEWWFWYGHPRYVAILGWLPDRVGCSCSALLLLLSIVGVAIAFARSWVRGQREGTRLRHLGNTALACGGVIGWLYLLLVFPWLALHGRSPLEERRGWPAARDGQEAVQALRATYDELLAQVGATRPSFDFADLEPSVDVALTRNLTGFLPPGSACGHVKELPSGLLMAFGVSGIYLPGCCEPHVDPALPPRRRAFVMAHEKLHRLGVTSEAEASFLAFQALRRSDRIELRYAALLALHPFVYLATRGEDGTAPVSSWVHEDWIATVLAFRAAEVSALRTIQETTNDAYLNLAGDRGGIASYGQFPVLVVRERLARVGQDLVPSKE